MFEVLKEAQNAMTIREYVRDRDGEIICSFDIGAGFGIFKNRESADIEADSANRNAKESVLVHYKYNGVQTKEIGKKEYSSMFEEPFVTTGDRECRILWRNKEYVVTKVGYNYDIHGNFVGFRVWCSNENVKFY